MPYKLVIGTGRRAGVVGAMCLLLLAPHGAGAASAGRAFWASLLVPGWGQYHAGQPRSAAVFAFAEAALWGGFFGLRQVADIRRDNFRSYASEHAGAVTRGKGDLFYDDLGFYQSVQQHNAFARRAEGPTAQLYAEGSDFFWEWDTDASRQRYRKLRNSSEASERGALFTTGLVVVNHLLSAVHAARVARSSETAYRLEVAPIQGQWGLALRRSF
jgi:hypothetical protein